MNDPLHNGEKNKRPRLLKKLPDWFRLENYEPVQNLDALGWLQQLYVRQTCFRQLNEIHSETPSFQSGTVR